MNPIYEMFNNTYIQEQVGLKHSTQIDNILKSAHKLQDFLDSLDDIKPEYRMEASQTFCTLLIKYINENSN